MRHTHEGLQRADFLSFCLGERATADRLGAALQFLNGAQARLHFVVDVFRHEDYFINDLRLETEPSKRLLQLLIELLQPRQQPGAARLVAGALPRGKLVINFRIQFAHAFDQPPQGP